MAAAPSPWSTSTPWTTPSRRWPVPPTGTPLFDVRVPAGHVRDRPRCRGAGGRCLGLLLQVPPQHARRPRRRGRRRRRRARRHALRAAAGGPQHARVAPTSGWSCAARTCGRSRTGRAPRCGRTTAATPAPPSAAWRARHRGHGRQPAAPRRRVDDDAPARRPPRLGGRRPADDAPDRARRRADLRLPADGRRPPRARLVLLVPRPPDGPHRPQQLARPAGHVHRHRPAQSRVAACRRAAATCR